MFLFFCPRWSHNNRVVFACIPCILCYYHVFIFKYLVFWEFSPLGYFVIIELLSRWMDYLTISHDPFVTECICLCLLRLSFFLFHPFSIRCFVLSFTMVNTAKILSWVLCATLSTCHAKHSMWKCHSENYTTYFWQSIWESPFVFRQPDLCLTNYISPHLLCRLFMLHIFSVLNFNSAWAWAVWSVFDVKF